LSLQTGIFELQFNYQIALTTSLPPLFSLTPCRRRTPALPLAGHAPSSGQNRHRAPLSGAAQACHTPPAPLRATRRERRRLAVAALDVQATRGRATVPGTVPVALRSQLHFLLSAPPLPKAKGRVSLRQREHRRPPWPPPPPTASTRSPLLCPPSTQATPGNGFPSAH